MAKSKYKVQSSSKIAKISPLMANKPAPLVTYEPLAWAKVVTAVQHCQLEVGWLGVVEVTTEGYHIKEVYFPNQTVSATETDIGAEAFGDILPQVYADGYSDEQLRYWGHSHVNMGVTPSGQDESQVAEFLDSGCEFFIRGIYNKSGDSKVDVYDVTANCVYECVDNYPLAQDFDKAAFIAMLNTNVKTQTVRAYTGNYRGTTHLGRTTPNTPSTQPIYNQHWTDEDWSNWMYNEV